MSVTDLSRTIRIHHGHRKPYLNRETAVLALRWLHGPVGGSVYRCEVCGCWHVVSPRKVS